MSLYSRREIPRGAGFLRAGVWTVIFVAISILLLFSGCSLPGGNATSTSISSSTVSRDVLPSSSVDFREESIYFLIPSRFYDGDSSNNVPDEWCSYNPDNPNSEITDPNDVPWRGDFRGLIDYGLDYIADLGFTAVWLTPIVENRSPLDYHGYHAWDFTAVDPRLETPGYTYQDFIDAAHARGIKVIQDVVWNHSSRYGIKDVAELKYNTDPDADWYAPPNPDWEYDGLTPNPYDGKIWSRANIAPMPAPYNENLSLYNWPGTESFVDTSDPDWFHHSGNGFAQGWDDTENLYYRALSDDTPDLNTESQEVRDYLVNAYDRYLDMGVDAFRVDTVKHMERDSVLYFVNAFKAHDPDLFLFGEVAQKRHELHDVEEINPHWYTWDGAVGNSNNSGLAVLDFYAEATFHGVFEENQAFSGVQAAARYDDLYSDPSTNVMWLDNHDFGPNNDWNRRFSGSAETLASYINFSWTWRGIPSLYYGTEIQFMKGAYTDIHEAADINRSLDNTGRAYYGDNIFSASGNPLYQHIKKMNAIRTALPALQKGSWYWAGNPSSGDGVGYVREYDGQTVAVGLAKNSSVSFHFTGLPAGIYLDAVTGAEVSSDGSLDFTVTSGSAGIYVLNGPGLIGALGAGFFQSSSDGQGGSDGGGDSTAAWNEAYFRGTPNDWGLTAMTKRADGTFETTQTFADADPRFKITRYQDWTAAVPAADFLISDGAGDYLIAFDSISGDITVTKQNDNGGATTGAWDQAWFRGTPNGWSSTAMSYNSASGFWESTQTFGADNPRFKVDHYADWTDAYPAQDFLITDGPGEYLIQFSDADYSLVVTRLQGSTYSLSGAVSMGGSPLNGITVSAGGQSAVSGADGSWSIAGLAPGDYTVGVSGGSYVYTPATQSVTIGSADISGINFTAALPGNDLVLHFAEYESADAYFLHPWDGLDGDRAMAYEGYINGRHWWTVSVTDAPASFMFCFTNSNNNWDGGNRSYSAQGDEVYILPWDSSVYLSRP